MEKHFLKTFPRIFSQLHLSGNPLFKPILACFAFLARGWEKGAVQGLVQSLIKIPAYSEESVLSEEWLKHLILGVSSLRKSARKGWSKQDLKLYAQIYSSY
jgi:hypothetical protein